jgi:miniconductance mechanosensitive channel
MTMEEIQAWINENPTVSIWILGVAVLGLSVVMFVIARFVIARGLVYLSKRTETKYDDIVVEKLRPFRFAWIAPLLVIYFLASLLPVGKDIVQNIALFFILWLGVFTIDSLLNAANAIYESSHYYRGESIQGYLDLLKVFFIVAGILLSVSILTGQSPVVLLSGLGVIMALLILVFRDTILSFVASIQINAADLLMEGDWIEMPSFKADGEVINISLHSVKLQNWDKSITFIPTYKFMDTPYKNWRGMKESGGRRIKRAIHIDLNSVRFCDREMLERLGRIDLIHDIVEGHLAQGVPCEEEGATADSPFDCPQVTNIEVFQAYINGQLKLRKDIHQEGFDVRARQLAPGPDGLPLEVLAFSTTTVGAEYEAIQEEIIDHMLAAMPYFGLRVFQKPTDHPALGVQ